MSPPHDWNLWKKLSNRETFLNIAVVSGEFGRWKLMMHGGWFPQSCWVWRASTAFFNQIMFCLPVCILLLMCFLGLWLSLFRPSSWDISVPHFPFQNAVCSGQSKVLSSEHRWFPDNLKHFFEFSFQDKNIVINCSISLRTFIFFNEFILTRQGRL